MIDVMEFPPPEKRKKYPSRCSVCGGRVVERLETLSYPGPGELPRVITGVPAGVCEQCGEKYLRPEVIADIERILADAPAREEAIAVWEYAKAG